MKVLKFYKLLKIIIIMYEINFNLEIWDNLNIIIINICRIIEDFYYKVS